MDAVNILKTANDREDKKTGKNLGLGVNSKCPWSTFDPWIRWGHSVRMRISAIYWKIWIWNHILTVMIVTLWQVQTKLSSWKFDFFLWNYLNLTLWHQWETENKEIFSIWLIVERDGGKFGTLVSNISIWFFWPLMVIDGLFVVVRCAGCFRARFSKRYSHSSEYFKSNFYRCSL